MKEIEKKGRQKEKERREEEKRDSGRKREKVLSAICISKSNC